MSEHTTVVIAGAEYQAAIMSLEAEVERLTGDLDQYRAVIKNLQVQIAALAGGCLAGSISAHHPACTVSPCTCHVGVACAALALAKEAEK